MKKSRTISDWGSCLSLLLLLLLGTSCVRDDREECGLTVRLRYTYNMAGTDAFEKEVAEMSLWIFNDRQQLVRHLPPQPAQENVYLGYLPQGSYTFVALARSVGSKGAYTDFDIPVLTPGDSITLLTERLQRDERGVNDNHINSLLAGSQKVSVSGVRQRVVMEMMKCTNTLRLLFLSAHPLRPLQAGDLDISVEGKNGWLAHDASTFKSDPLIYRPYLQQPLENMERGGDEESVQGVVAELTTSRLLYTHSPLLVVRHRESGKVILKIRLSRLLSLQAIEEHRREWGNQEYLDRQDEFVLTFIVDGCTWMRTRIVVNGWVLSLSDVELS